MVDGVTFTKLYTGNVNESVNFQNSYGSTGSATVTISRIDKDIPYATNVVYSPTSNTNGNVTVTMTINEAVQAISGRTG